MILNVTKKSTIFSPTIVLLFLIILGAAIFAYKYLTRPDTYLKVGILVSGAEWWREDRQPPSWLTDSLKIGDSERTSSGKKLAEIVDIKRYEEGSNKIVYLTVSLLVDWQPKTNRYFFKQQPLEIGGLLDLSLGESRLTGSIVNTQSSPDDPKFIKRLITVRLLNRFPWFADSIQIGDEQIDETTDQSAVKVIGKRVILADTLAYTSTGQIVAGKDPLKRDIELTLEIQVINRGGLDYFFYYQPVKIGNLLYLSLPRYNLYEAYVTRVE